MNEGYEVEMSLKATDNQINNQLRNQPASQMGSQYQISCKHFVAILSSISNILIVQMRQ